MRSIRASWPWPRRARSSPPAAGRWRISTPSRPAAWPTWPPIGPPRTRIAIAREGKGKKQCRISLSIVCRVRVLRAVARAAQWLDVGNEVAAATHQGDDVITRQPDISATAAQAALTVGRTQTLPFRFSVRASGTIQALPALACIAPYVDRVRRTPRLVARLHLLLVDGPIGAGTGSEPLTFLRVSFLVACGVCLGMRVIVRARIRSSLFAIGPVVALQGLRDGLGMCFSISALTLPLLLSMALVIGARLSVAAILTIAASPVFLPAVTREHIEGQWAAHGSTDGTEFYRRIGQVVVSNRGRLSVGHSEDPFRCGIAALLCENMAVPRCLSLLYLLARIDPTAVGV
jgi:hypothetical protein